MAGPGWFNDPSDSDLARWFDGQQWTRHTLVKSGWTVRKPPPPPTDHGRTQAFPRAELPPLPEFPPPLVPLVPVFPSARSKVTHAVRHQLRHWWRHRRA